jgi:alkylhydroperoxidase family enzyme
MGGHPPLGYDLKERKLHVNEAEAELVRRIFVSYADRRCIRTLRNQLHAEGAVSKQRTSQAGITYGGMPFSAGALYKILGNRTYLGLAVHKGKAYPGEHQAIVDQDLWDRVQEQLARNRVQRLGGTHAKQSSLLAGLLYDADGRRLTPSHATKGKRRYRYYVTPAESRDLPGPSAGPWRIPASEIESRIRAEILDLLKSPARLDTALGLETTDITEKLALYQAAAVRATALQAALPATLRSFLQAIVARITLCEDGIEITLRPARLQHAILQPQDSRVTEATSADTAKDELRYALVIKTRLKRCGSELRLVLCDDPHSERLPRPNAGLIKTIAKARLWAKQLIDGEISNIAEIAKREETSRPHASRLLSLAFLAPDIVAAILEGRHPPEVTVEILIKAQRLPLGWEDQRRDLGFP